MKTTSNNSGADEAERYFNEHYRDKDGKVLWHKVRQAIKGTKAIPLDEFLKGLRERKKKDGNNPNPA